MLIIGNLTLYGLLISEDNALLLGSLLLFGLLAVVMTLTRKVDWYQRTAARAQKHDDDDPPTQPPYGTTGTFAS